MNIFGKYFDDNEKVLKSLTKIYGIGRKTAHELGMTFGIGYTNRVKDLSKETWSRVIQAIELGPKKYNTVIKSVPVIKTYTLINSNSKQLKQSKLNLSVKSTVESLTDSENPFSYSENKKLSQLLCENRAITAIRDNIDLAKKIKSYRGLRHIEGLPCRGQRTHTNAITARKKRLSS